MQGAEAGLVPARGFDEYGGGRRIPRNIKSAGGLRWMGGRPPCEGAKLKSSTKVTLLRRDLCHPRLTELRFGKSHSEWRNVTGAKSAAGDPEQPLLKREQPVGRRKAFPRNQGAVKGGVDISVNFPACFIDFRTNPIAGPLGGRNPKPSLSGDFKALAERCAKIGMRTIARDARTRPDRDLGIVGQDRRCARDRSVTEAQPPSCNLERRCMPIRVHEDLVQRCRPATRRVR